MDLSEFLSLQRELQIDSFGYDPVLMTGQERIDFVRWNVLALEDELHEAMKEISWKPWATGEFFNRELFLKELVDAFHFFTNIMLVAAPSLEEHSLAREFALLYIQKRQKNVARQVNGYDGVSTKCPNCSRALDDVEIMKDALGLPYCGGCGQHLKREHVE